MKSRISQQDNQTPHPKPLAISFPEIALIIGYFLAVWLIPTSWLDTAPGAVAFAIASKVNPYLSEYSIAFAADPQYFIHCHVLATWMISPLLLLIILRRNGGIRGYDLMYMKSLNDRSPVQLCFAYLFGLFAWLAMLWLVDFPLVRAERGVWVNPIGVCFFALITGAMISVFCTVWFLFKAMFSIRKGESK